MEKEKTLKAKRGWFGFLWSNTQIEETEELNSAAAISNNLNSVVYFKIFIEYIINFFILINVLF